ncbi:unnamed protein product, partial [Didymodactylos carnosus]
FRKISNRVCKGRDDEDYVERDLSKWMADLKELKAQLNKPSTVRIEEDKQQSPWIRKIRVREDIHDQAKLDGAVVRTTRGKMHTSITENNRDGTANVFYRGQHIAGSPFKFHVNQVQTGYVTAYGSGLSHGVCNEPCKFRIVTKDAFHGGLSVTVEGPSKAEIQCKDNIGTCDFTYLPVCI